MTIARSAKTATFLTVLAASLASGALAGPDDPSRFEPVDYGAQSVLYDWNLDSPEAGIHALDFVREHAEAMQKHGDLENSRIVVVSRGKDVHALSRLNRERFPDVYERLIALAALGVELRVGANAASRRGYEPTDFYDLVTVVPAAAAEIARYRGEGYSYMPPALFAAGVATPRRLGSAPTEGPARVLANSEEGRAAAGQDRAVKLTDPAVDAAEVSGPYPRGTAETALGESYLVGTLDEPAARLEPVVRIEKVSAATRDQYDQGWDVGGLFVALQKLAGDAYGAAASFYAKATGTDEFDVVGLHARGRLENENAGAWGGWSYVDVRAMPRRRAIGHEINVHADKDYALVWEADGGPVTGLAVATADGPESYGNEAIKISENTGSGWIIGLNIAPGSIRPSIDGNGEAIFIAGADTAERRFGGIRFGHDRSVHYDYGVDFAAGRFADGAAIVLGDGNKIVLGDRGRSASRYLEASDESGAVSVAGLSLDLVDPGAELRIAGSRVLVGRRTGWEAPTGRANRSSFSTETVTLEGLAQRVKALHDDLAEHGLIGRQ